MTFSWLKSGLWNMREHTSIACRHGIQVDKEFCGFAISVFWAKPKIILDYQKLSSLFKIKFKNSFINLNPNEVGLQKCMER